MSSVSSQSRLGAQFQPPGFLTAGKRRPSSSTSQGSRLEEKSAAGNTFKKRRVEQEQTTYDCDSTDEDEEECIPMSETQLNKHSKGPSSTSNFTTELDSSKILDARLERLALKSRTAQHKANRVNPTNNLQSPQGIYANASNGSRYVLCMWRNPQTRKHKTWDGDACLIIGSGPNGNRLIDANNKQCLARDFKIRSHFESGDVFNIGSKEVEIDREITEREYRTGKGDTVEPVRGKLLPVSNASQISKSDSVRQFRSPTKLPIRGQKTVSIQSTSLKEVMKVTSEPVTSVSAKSFYAKLPMEAERPTKVQPSGLFTSEKGDVARPRYDPTETGSIVMERPSAAHQEIFNKKGLPIVDVVVNPILSRKLRPHQVEGVRFLYERVMGMRMKKVEDESFGAILADEMGLGKTLQTIATIDMLLNQRCYFSPNPRTIERALIVCPLSLVNNWSREFHKWVGKKIKVQIIDEKTKIESTVNGNYQVLIIGYEKLLISHQQVANVQPKFGLLVCDEAHRLKNLVAKTSQMLSKLSIDRRILLSGTPIQNNLLEFHAMIDLVAPGILSSQKTFKKVFEVPILRSRMPHCSTEDLQLGKERSDALQIITNGILLRRTADLLADYLPPKYEQVVFCSPTSLQIQIYQKFINSERIHDLVDGAASHSFALTAIGVLRKLCNSPELLIKATTSDGAEGATTKALLGGIAKYLPSQITNSAEMSGKMICVTKMLLQIKQQTTDKVVLVSNFTATLDILEAICRKHRFGFVRIDGSTKQEDRKNYINNFNQSDRLSQFVFLLSSKAGGTGINLIGANRLILFDSDWNPSVDRQAMARIHRDGQKKTCYIYRIIIPGTMDEKIYQRQISKLSLSDALMDKAGTSDKSTDSFTPDELRDIFRLHLDTPCLSHDQMKCPCQGNGIAGAGKEEDDEQAEEKDDNESSSDDTPPPALNFVKASQIHASQSRTKKKDHDHNLAALLRWAHHDCTKEGNTDTKDSIVNSMVAQQHKTGFSIRPDQQADESDEFDMTKIKAGSILYVYAEASREKKIQEAE